MVSVKQKVRVGLVIVLGTLIATAAAVYFPRESVASAEELSAPPDEAGVWFCPMHAHVTSDHEGSCPICGMKLVKRTSAAAESQSDQVFVAQPMQSRVGVVTEALEPTDFSPTMPVTALAVADERHAITSSPKVEGWIRRLGVSVVGQPVRAGDVLYEIYSPELQQRQRDYIDLLTRRDALLEAKRTAGGMSTGNSPPDLMLASVARERYRARSRLIAADVPVHVLDDIEKFRRAHDVVPVLAEHEGVVTSIDAREGSYIRSGETVLGYSDLRATWAEVSLNPESLGHLSAGTIVELRSDVDRSQRIPVVLDGRAATVDPVTRTARLRVRIPDGMGVFLPGTLLEARIVMKPHRALTVPVDTVLRTGSGDFVVLAGAADHFSKVAVRLGAESGDRVEVLEGLSAGQRVVTNGQFLLSAESSFRSSWRRLAADSDMPMASPLHVSHDHLEH
jgi:Cu(I)/Ag(I) efflux system membrane fusion protein